MIRCTRLLTVNSVRVLISAFLLSSTGLAAGSSPKEDVLRTQNWSKSLRTDLVRSLCAPQAYFLTCFETSAEICKQVVGKNFDACATVPRVKTATIARKNAIELAGSIGTCTGVNSEKQLRKKSPALPKCAEPQAWL